MIVELYWQRREAAISQTAEKYGGYCHAIAFNILSDAADSEECVSDAYLNAWNSMPPHRPKVLRTFLGKITRNLALNRFMARTAQKRGGGQVPLALEELCQCIPAPGGTEKAVDDRALARLLNEFLASLPARSRKIFMRRYWYLSPVGEIARDFGMGESSVKMSLLRSRRKLRELLEKEGVLL